MGYRLTANDRRERDLRNKVTALGDALKMIVRARDYFAEHGTYPEDQDKPAPDQCFDDWAADIASNALKHCDIAKLALTD